MRFIFWFSVVLFFSCRQSSKIPEDFDYGKIENGVYANAYFGMEVTVPANWLIQSKEQVDQLMNRGMKVLEEKNKEVGSHVKKTQEKTAIILAVFKYPTDSVINGYNPYFMIITEKLNPLSGIEKGIDYLENERKLMEKAPIGYHVTSDYSKKNIGNKEFDVLRFTKAVGEQMDVQRVYHVRVEKEYAMNIILSYASNKQEEELIEVLNNIKFR